jgi:hypothetical protein
MVFSNDAHFLEADFPFFQGTVYPSWILGPHKEGRFCLKYLFLSLSFAWESVARQIGVTYYLGRTKVNFQQSYHVSRNIVRIFVGSNLHIYPVESLVMNNQ